MATQEEKHPNTDILGTQTPPIDENSLKPKLSGDKQKQTAPEDKTLTKNATPKPKNEFLTNPVIALYSDISLIPSARPEISTYIPSPYRMYQIVHEMDVCMATSFYFNREAPSWHPFISRIYYGVLFIIQTMRAEASVNLLSPSKKAFLSKFEKTYPPEQLAIASPLTLLFQGIAPSYSANPGFSTSCPATPPTFGPQLASQLITYDEQHSPNLLLPNIPMLISLARLITTSIDDAHIPDFTNPDTFWSGNDHPITLNGHLFPLNAWTEADRSALCTPGLLYPPEAPNTIAISFRMHGRRINLPETPANTNLQSIASFLRMDTSLEWFGTISSIMNTYATYFQAHFTLTEQAKDTTVTGLVETVHPHLGTIISGKGNLMNRGFPSQPPFKFSAYHRSVEDTLPFAASGFARGTQLLIAPTHANLPSVWKAIGTHGRHGSRWHYEPFVKRTVEEDSSNTLGILIKAHYHLNKSISTKAY